MLKKIGTMISCIPFICGIACGCATPNNDRVSLISTAVIDALEQTTPESVETVLPTLIDEEPVEITPIVEDTSDDIPALEDILYHTWYETEDGYYVYEEVVSPTMLVGAEDYVIDSYSMDEDRNIVIYWHTDYMKYRLIAFADKEYKYMEANYYVEETNNYESESLSFER